MLWIYIVVALLIGAGIHSVIASRAGRRSRTAELFLVYLLVGYYGVAMVLAGAVQLLNPQAIARLKGWPASEPMQTLYAFALFGLAASAILGVWWRGNYLLAPAISGSVLLFGGAYVHGSEILDRGAFVLAKDGPQILLDFAVPVTVLVLAATYGRQGRSEGVQQR